MPHDYKNEFTRIIEFLMNYHNNGTYVQYGCYLYKKFKWGKTVWVYDDDGTENVIKIQSENFAGGSVYLRDNGWASFAKFAQDVWKGEYPVALLRLITPHNHLNSTTWNEIFERVK